MYWPESELVVTEPDWFGQVLSSIYSSMPKLDIDMDIRAVGPSSHVWPKTKLEAFLKDQLTDQMVKHHENLNLNFIREHLNGSVERIKQKLRTPNKNEKE